MDFTDWETKPAATLGFAALCWQYPRSPSRHSLSEGFLTNSKVTCQHALKSVFKRGTNHLPDDTCTPLLPGDVVLSPSIDSVFGQAPWESCAAGLSTIHPAHRTARRVMVANIRLAPPATLDATSDSSTV
jgi:hypothetical protein